MKKTIETIVSLEEMKNFCREHNLCSQVAELNFNGDNLEGALEWVYDAHTLTKAEFTKKYFG